MSSGRLQAGWKVSTFLKELEESLSIVFSEA